MNKNENDTIKWGVGGVNPLSEINIITFIDLALGQPPFPKSMKTDRNWTTGEVLEKDIEDQEKDIEEQSKDIHLSTIHL